MKCDHCRLGESHYDYKEILAIEKENLRPTKEIEETRGGIDRIKGKKKERRKVRGAIKLLSFLELFSLCLITGGVVGCALVAPPFLVLICIGALSVFVHGVFLFLQFDDGFYKKKMNNRK